MRYETIEILCRKCGKPTSPLTCADGGRWDLHESCSRQDDPSQHDRSPFTRRALANELPAKVIAY